MYRTDNPDSSDFREYLLLNDIAVEDDFDTLIFFDILFYGIFFSAVGYGIYRLLKFKISTFKVIRHNDTRFSDIAGLDELKEDISKTVEEMDYDDAYKEMENTVVDF